MTISIDASSIMGYSVSFSILSVSRLNRIQPMAPFARDSVSTIIPMGVVHTERCPSGGSVVMIE